MKTQDGKRLARWTQQIFARKVPWSRLLGSDSRDLGGLGCSVSLFTHQLLKQLLGFQRLHSKGWLGACLQYTASNSVETSLAIHFQVQPLSFCLAGEIG